tara:strand:+ start:12165 stop:12572 length:408 start_codon:yes stop_codon:yes gene_type:complete
MPAQTIWMIRFSLIYLLISVLIGSLLITHKAINIHPMIWSLLPIHFEFAIWGWLVQFVMGTAYWMFPKKLEGERRGPILPAWIMVCLFNFGLISLVIVSLVLDFSVAIVGRSLIAVSIVIFGGLIWQRVVTYRNN